MMVIIKVTGWFKVKNLLVVLSFIVCFSGILVADGYANPDMSGTLRRLVREALKNDSRIAAKYREVSIARIKIKKAEHFFQQRPEVDLSFKDRNSHDYNTVDLEFSFGVPLEISGQRSLREQIAQLNYLVKLEELKSLKNKVAFEVERSFIKIAIDKKKIALLGMLCNKEEKILKDMREKNLRGEVSEIVLTAFEMKKFRCKETLLGLKESIIAEKSRLENLIGSSMPENLVFSYDSLVTIPPSFKYSVTMITENPQLKIEKLKLQLLEIEKDLEKKNSGFSVIVPSVIYSREDEDNLVGVGVSVPLPFFTNEKEDLEIAQVKIGEQREKIRTLKKALQRKVKKEFSVYKLLLERKKLFEGKINFISRTSLEKVKNLYISGKVNYNFFAQTWIESAMIQIDYYDLLRQFYETVFKIWYITGNNINWAR